MAVSALECGWCLFSRGRSSREGKAKGPGIPEQHRQQKKNVKLRINHSAADQ
ncbi:hypothetical protein CIHG_08847 [Coccidioides immitis H538.4]|uniref:Uncharacterized protein n=3 Tax=Coccidioides immitis TaxID=5501 RepID=A0A0J8QXH8_COCIT|nr:hypothetical protein CIRG_04742 [Coccidioides immitis RMSCC 2394]KMU77589.1 hypothetical protein CISG_01346 [Coccidioides immitis RMSCC 3703]KMU90992.1 hypothetical protein CIHG_08847 [Coccidioides immitis H538.4]